MPIKSGLPSPRTLPVIALTFSLLPFLIVAAFSDKLYSVMDTASYLVFHNVTEFFSVMVSLSIFGVGWFSFEQSRDRRILFLSTAFLAIGLMDFMHTLGYTGMPAFITPNSPNKSTQLWIAARAFTASAFLISAFVYPDTPSRWLSKRLLITGAVSVPLFVFVGVTFFPSRLPATFVEGVGLTAFKKISEYLIIFILSLAAALYWRRISKTGDRLLMYYLAAFILCIFSELVFAVYKSVFDTFNVLGHIYKVAAFYLIYKATFESSVGAPYMKLSDAIERMQLETIERKQAEEKVLRLNEGLEQMVIQRTAQLEGALGESQRRGAELAIANKELDAFSYSVSHDLRAPLRAIGGFSQIIREDFSEKLGDEGTRMLNIIHDNTQKMGRLIDDLLSFSRMGRQEMTLLNIDMTALARSVITEMEPSAAGRRLQFILRQLPDAKGDQAMIRQVFANLIGNAIKFTRVREIATIEIRGWSEGGENIYSIRDNGAGFDMKYANKLFGVFQRLHRTEEFEGTGVGLAIVQRIVHRHRGRLWAEGKVDEGATLYFTLPGRADAAA